MGVLLSIFLCGNFSSCIFSQSKYEDPSRASHTHLVCAQVQSTAMPSLSLLICLLAVVSPFALASPPSRRDMRRAYQPRPSSTSHVTGPHPRAAFQAMNTFLVQQPVTTQSCESFVHDELNTLSELLLSHMDEQFNSLYKSKQDNRHQKFSLPEMLARWRQESDRVLAQPAMHGEGSASYAMVRDGKWSDFLLTCPLAVLGHYLLSQHCQF